MNDVKPNEETEKALNSSADSGIGSCAKTKNENKNDSENTHKVCI